MWSPVARAKLSDQVYEQLRDRILGEQYTPGDRLPSERELCQSMDVNRSSVREALKRLEHARLISTRQGGGSIVLDFRSHGGLDLLRDLVAPQGRIDPIAARSLFEMAIVLWPEMARHAAGRAQKAELTALRDLVEQIEGVALGDAAALQDLDLELFCLLARASENVAFMLVMNTVRSVYGDYKQLFTQMYLRRAEEQGVAYRRLYKAIHKRDGARAARLCRQLLDEHVKTFLDQE